MARLPRRNELSSSAWPRSRSCGGFADEVDGAVAPMRLTADSRRLPQLDGLRALAATAVILSHTAPVDRVNLTFLGPLAVRLFFVLSGFLITGILLDARAQCESGEIGRFRALRTFYARRCLRIFPVYYLVLLLAWLIGIHGLRENIFWALAYLTNVHFALDRAWHGAGQHLWTLAVEEQFYLIWPTLILFLPRRWLPGFLIATVALSPLCRLALLLQTGSSLRATLPLPSCADTLGIGGLLAWSLRVRPDLWNECQSVCLSAGIGILVWASIGSKSVTVLLYDTGSALTFSWVVRTWPAERPASFSAACEPGLSFTWERSATACNLHHPFIMDVLGYRIAGWKAFPIVLPVTILVASCSWYAVEKPFNNLKRRFPMGSPRAGSSPGRYSRSARRGSSAHGACRFFWARWHATSDGERGHRHV